MPPLLLKSSDELAMTNEEEEEVDDVECHSKDVSPAAVLCACAFTLGFTGEHHVQTVRRRRRC